MTDVFIKITKKDAEAFRDLSKAAILVLIEMRFYAGKDGRAFPLQETISESTGLSLGSVKRAIKELKEIGELSIKHKKRKGSNVYNTGGIKKNNEVTNLIPQKVSDLTPQKVSDLTPESNKSNTPKVTNLIPESNKSDTPNIIRSKELDPINKKAKLKEQTKPIINDEVDLRDLWLAELWAKQSTPQGWRSLEVQKDFDLIKEGASVLQVSKAVRKLDSFLTERGINGVYMGRVWASMVRDRWILKESNEPITKRDIYKMRHSNITLDPEVVEDVKDQAIQAAENNDKAQAAAMDGNGKAQTLWARFRANTSDYEQCANAVFDWVASGGLTEEIQDQIYADPNLEDFAALVEFAAIKQTGILCK